jgi:hypothetical protein
MSIYPGSTHRPPVEKSSVTHRTKKILIQYAPTADSRTVNDPDSVTPELLLDSSRKHIRDVKAVCQYVNKLITRAADNHDHDKISDNAGFYRDFVDGFRDPVWGKNHVLVNRHHLDDPEGVPKDVNLVDVIEMIADCVVAGLARSGKVRVVKIAPEVLETAVANTVLMLAGMIEVVDYELGE